MRKRILTAILALVMCLGLALPAFAASDLTGGQLFAYEDGGWGNGPSLTLKGVTGERAVDLQLSYCYDVEVGGSLVLDMPYPAGMNRTYTIMPAGVYISPDFTDSLDNGQDWDLPAAAQGGVFDETSGKTQYVYNFTESDMGQLDGYDKAIYMHISWDEASDPNADYADDSGSVFFLIHVVPAETSTPAQPSAPSAPAQTVTAAPTSAPVLVDGKNISFDAYEINDNNYFKLRDLAYVLNGTGKQFGIEWNGEANAISLTSGAAYTAVGGEMTSKGAGSQTATPTTSKILLDGKEVSFTAYEIGGNNYFKLRDVGAAFNFGVDWNGETGTISIDTSKSYTPG